ncbi:MAG: hypothetical protein NTY12_01320 [Candidatus Falkowbacteria bacterium]|nr:hypothetical protein [Candidatus Falkowbacteria bacterium]
MKFFRLNLLFTFFVAIIMVTFFANSASAANFYFRMDKTAYKTGESGYVTLNIDTQNKTVNAVEAVVDFDPSLIEVTKYVPDKCIINFWVQSPAIDNINGKITFKGVILNPAYNGPQGRLIGFNFKSKAPGSMPFKATSLVALAHDGKGTGLASAGTNRSISIAGKPLASAANLALSSSSHPDQSKWYNKTTASIFWKADKGVTAVAYAFNQIANFEVPDSAVTEFSSAIERDLTSGTWYAHVRAKDQNSTWLKTLHFKINIDNEMPSSNAITVLPRQNDSFLPVIRAKATDRLSGVVIYEIWNGTKMIFKDKEINNLRLKSLVVGKNVIEIKAFDAAGNVRSDKFTVLYNPLQPSKKAATPAAPVEPSAPVVPKITPSAPSTATKPTTTKKTTTNLKIVQPAPVKPKAPVVTPAKPAPVSTPTVTPKPKKNYSVLFD